MSLFQQCVGRVCKTYCWSNPSCIFQRDYTDIDVGVFWLFGWQFCNWKINRDLGLDYFDLPVFVHDSTFLFMIYLYLHRFAFVHDLIFFVHDLPFFVHELPLSFTCLWFTFICSWLMCVSGRSTAGVRIVGKKHWSRKCAPGRAGVSHTPGELCKIPVDEIFGRKAKINWGLTARTHYPYWK